MQQPGSPPRSEPSRQEEPGPHRQHHTGRRSTGQPPRRQHQGRERSPATANPRTQGGRTGRQWQKETHTGPKPAGLERLTEPQAAHPETPRGTRRGTGEPGGEADTAPHRGRSPSKTRTQHPHQQQPEEQKSRGPAEERGRPGQNQKPRRGQTPARGKNSCRRRKPPTQGKREEDRPGPRGPRTQLHRHQPGKAQPGNPTPTEPRRGRLAEATSQDPIGNPVARRNPRGHKRRGPSANTVPPTKRHGTPEDKGTYSRNAREPNYQAHSTKGRYHADATPRNPPRAGRAEPLPPRKTGSGQPQKAPAAGRTRQDHQPVTNQARRS